MRHYARTSPNLALLALAEPPDSPAREACSFEKQCTQNQKRLTTMVKELERSNRELEQFASIASHELSEPLTTVESCLEMLSTQERDLGIESKEYVEIALRASRRLRALISDLLAYSSIGAKDCRFVAFQSGSAVEEAISNLRQSIERSGATLSVGKLPTVCADPRRTVQLFQNLIGNAIKYRSEKPPLIEIRAERMPGCWIFSVKDNGMGIHPDSRLKVFEMFHRAHTHADRPGTGIGLAICEKIVEQRGGSVWVESEVGVGSKFNFTIPDELPC